MEGGFGIYLDSTFQEIRANTFEQFKKLMHMRLENELSGVFEKSFLEEKGEKCE